MRSQDKYKLAVCCTTEGGGGLKKMFSKGYLFMGGTRLWFIR